MFHNPGWPEEPHIKGLNSVVERRLAESSPEKWSEATQGQTGRRQVATTTGTSTRPPPRLRDLLLVHYLSAVHHTCGGRRPRGKRAGALEV